LDADVEAVYAAMLADPAAGVESLALLLGRSEDGIRKSLDQLADLALLRWSWEQPGRMLAVNPVAGLQALIRQQEEELARRRREIEDNHAAAARMIAHHAVPRAGADNEHLYGLDAIQAKLEELCTTATDETLSLVPGKAIPAETLAAARPLDAEQIVRRGIPGRVLYQDAVRNDSATVAYGMWMSEHGTRVRTAPVLPQRLYIVDRRIALVPLDPADSSAGALCTTAPGVVSQLVALFEQIWVGATPLEEPRPVESATGLRDVERELLRLLSGGSTDEAAANRLGISLRTVRRIMADLMARLNATSRFEAGIKAAKRGWL
jgi:DNA-binding CsgD family transcriptional regulator